MRAEGAVGASGRDGPFRGATDTVLLVGGPRWHVFSWMLPVQAASAVDHALHGLGVTLTFAR
jgi:hypothetical protein